MGVDAVAIDTAHGHSAGVVNAIHRIKSAWPELAVTAGNVVTATGTRQLIEAARRTGVRVVLAGNPNCGKTSLFNALTGARQKVGNYPGVTVETARGPVQGAVPRLYDSSFSADDR